MTPSRRQVESLLTRVKSLIPPGRDGKDYLRECLDAHIADSSPEMPMGIVPVSMLSATKMLGSARTIVEKIDAPEYIAEQPEGIVDLGMIEWLLRPSLPISAGLIKVPPGPPWDTLSQHVVVDLSKAVCRLDLFIEGREPWQLGTGFLIGTIGAGQFVIMTNTHVVNDALKYGWRKFNEIELVCDFERFSIDVGGKHFSIARQYPHKVHSQYDLSLLILEANFGSETLWTESLSIGSEKPDPEEGLKIGVIGHPTVDSTRDPFPKYFGFGNEFGIKRFSPGYIRATQKRRWDKNEVDLFLHDATTLSGSSGSCIVDLETNNVVGLHFGGWSMPKRIVRTSSGDDVVAQLFEANGAVPLWRLVDDPLLHEVRFS